MDVGAVIESGVFGKIRHNGDWKLGIGRLMNVIRGDEYVFTYAVTSGYCCPAQPDLLVLLMEWSNHRIFCGFGDNILVISVEY